MTNSDPPVSKGRFEYIRSAGARPLGFFNNIKNVRDTIVRLEREVANSVRPMSALDIGRYLGYASIELKYNKDAYDSNPAPLTGEYKVTCIVNSLNYRPGDILDEAEVETLCKGSQFAVTIK
jgi:hypothetical protein